MKILSEIKEQVAGEFGYKSNSVFNAYEQLIINPQGLTYKVLEEAIDEIAKHYAKEVAREALKNSSENADTKQGYCSDGWATVIEQDKFTDSDVAIVERLHGTLLENHGYSLESKLLTDARMLASKLKSKIK